MKLLVGPGEGPQASSFKSLEKGLGKSASTDFHSVLESRPKPFADVGQRVLGVLRWVILIVAVALSGLFASVESSRADLHYESSMEARCRPANPTTHSILRWKHPDACGNDCFVWRLVCSNGRHHDLQSQFNPASTQAQIAFYDWAPWSFLLYLVPFLALFGMAVLGVQRLELLLALDGLVLTVIRFFDSSGRSLSAVCTGYTSAIATTGNKKALVSGPPPGPARLLPRNGNASCPIIELK